MIEDRLHISNSIYLNLIRSCAQKRCMYFERSVIGKFAFEEVKLMYGNWFIFFAIVELIIQFKIVTLEIK